MADVNKFIVYYFFISFRREFFSSSAALKKASFFIRARYDSRSHFVSECIRSEVVLSFHSSVCVVFFFFYFFTTRKVPVLVKFALFFSHG